MELEINGKHLEKEGQAKGGTGFKIVAGEDSDSIFEENFQQEEKYEDMDKWSDDYGEEEAWRNPHDPYDMAGTEMKPEVLPLEPIIEENSVIKDGSLSLKADF